MIQIFLNLVLFICIILYVSYHIIHKEECVDNIMDYDVNNSEPSSPLLSWLPILGQKFTAAYNLEDNNTTDKGKVLFHLCDEQNIITAEEPNRRCLSLTMDVYDKHTGELLQRSGKSVYALPNFETIPTTCGFGQLTFDIHAQLWGCRCKAPDYFGGEYCDQPQYKLTRENKCSKVADARDVQNFNIATFNPVLGGVCVECSVYGAVPILDASEPMCIELNTDVDEVERTLFPVKRDQCFYDALNPHFNNSPVNKFIEGYGCSCDYYNGFVEAFVQGIAVNNEERSGPLLISNACIKVGETSEYHEVDLAYYCLKNRLNPIQVHLYTRTESPFDVMFEGKELLVLQPAASNVNENDWLNRNVKPISTQPIRRLNYPLDDWPIVNKLRLVNYYERRKETYPVSAYKLNVGTGFETKHWYETTNNRWLSNTIWGHPIVYTYHNKNAWTGKSTLNPIGVKDGWYYGITMKTKPGEVVRMDTRGYNRGGKIVTIPPNLYKDMLEVDDNTPYVWLLYTTYRFNPVAGN